MAKRRIIEVRHADSIEQIEAEIFRYGGFVFGLHWNKGKYEIVATELSTGMEVGRYSYYKFKAPKKELITRIKELVDSGQMEKAVKNGIQYIEKRISEIQEEEERLKSLRIKYQYPLNNGLR